MNYLSRTHAPDYVLIVATFFLVLFGILVLSSASSEIGKARFDDTYFYLKRQALNGILAGIIGFLIAYKTPPHYLRKIAVPLLLVSIAGLALVFTSLGISAGGATRWISIGGFSLQPAEILKLTFIVYVAAWLSGDVRKRKNFIEGFVPFMILCGLVAFLLFLQPTTSTAFIILSASTAMYFVSGGKFSYVVFAGIVGLVAVSALIFMSPYRMTRIKSYLNPEGDPLGAGYQTNQVLIALGSGGISGVGYGNSISKFYYLPEPISDSIFAIIGEEFGFIGSLVVISAFLILVLRMLRISVRAPDIFSKLIVVGVVTIVGVQAFINMAAISGLIPLTGVPLPFISYGGTALAVLLTSMGVVANISRYA